MGEKGGATWGLWRTMAVRWCGLGGEVLRRCSRGGRGCSAHEPRDGESVNALAVVAASQRCGFSGVVALPGDRLYENIDPAKPYMLEDPIRRAVWSGSLAPYIANKVKMSLSHILTKENVGVHKDFGLVVFKDVPKKREGISDSSENYQHYSSFLTETIQRLHGSESLNALPVEMDIYLKDLTDPNVKEDDILDHPIALPGRVFGDVSVEAYRLLCKQYPVVKNGKEILADRIIEAVGAKFKDALTWTIAKILTSEMAEDIPS
uniref:Uncharacterized protein n=1 Tax=Oryza nivara TaxID=4536 RepID=A0A0E0GFU6_ORYNI